MFTECFSIKSMDFGAKIYFWDFYQHIDQCKWFIFYRNFIKSSSKSSRWPATIFGPPMLANRWRIDEKAPQILKFVWHLPSLFSLTVLYYYIVSLVWACLHMYIPLFGFERELNCSSTCVAIWFQERKKSLANKFKLWFVWLFCHVGLQCSVETPHKIYCHSTFMRQHAYECDHWSLAHIIIPRRRLTHIFVKHWTNVSTNVCAIFMKK